MDQKKYDKLISLIMDRLDLTEIEKNCLKHENEQLKDRINNLIKRLEGENE